MAVSFDSSVNLGQVIEALAFVASVFTAWFGVKQSIALIAYRENEHHKDNVRRLDEMENELKKQTTILVELATQKTQLDNLRERMSYLERNRMEAHKHAD